jgi:hypothetical protein
LKRIELLIINQASNDVNAVATAIYRTNGFYDHILSPSINIPYKYIGFNINKLVGNDTTLIISELRLFGKEVVEDKNIYTIRSLNTYNDGRDSQSTTNAMLHMSNELVSSKNPSYPKLNTYNLNRISLEVADDIQDKTKGGWDNAIQFGAVFNIIDYNNNNNNIHL